MYGGKNLDPLGRRELGIAREQNLRGTMAEWNSVPQKPETPIGGRGLNDKRKRRTK